MATMQKPAVRKRTRKTKQEMGEEKIIKDRHIQEHTVPKLEAKTGNQSKALAAMRDGRQLVILSGAAGTGKSMLSAYIAATKLRTNQIDKIILIRSLISTSKSIGAIPGSVNDKLYPVLSPILSHLEYFLGKAYLTYALEKEIIQMMPLEFIRGASFSDSVIIAEEVQNNTPSEIMSLVTRLGENSFLYMTGDKKQNDLRGTTTGIEYVQQIIEKYSLPENSVGWEETEEFVNNTAVITFTNDDVVRSGITKAFVKAFNKEGI